MTFSFARSAGKQVPAVGAGVFDLAGRRHAEPLLSAFVSLLLRHRSLDEKGTAARGSGQNNLQICEENGRGYFGASNAVSRLPSIDGCFSTLAISASFSRMPMMIRRPSSMC